MLVDIRTFGNNQGAEEIYIEFLFNDIYSDEQYLHGKQKG